MMPPPIEKIFLKRASDENGEQFFVKWKGKVQRPPSLRYRPPGRPLTKYNVYQTRATHPAQAVLFRRTSLMDAEVLLARTLHALLIPYTLIEVLLARPVGTLHDQYEVYSMK